MPSYNIIITIILKSIMMITLCVPASLYAAERNFSIGSFENIQVDGDLVVNVATGRGPSASASGAHRQLDNLKFTRNGRTLKIHLNDSDRVSRKESARSEPLEIYISTSELKNAALHGNGIINIDKINIRKSRLSILGAGRINVDSAIIDNLTVSIHGNGNVAFETGRVDSSDFSINGFGTINAKKLTTKTIDLEHQGSANTIINVSGVANILNNGAGEIKILGKGNCIIKSIGSGKIHCDKIN